MKWRAPALVRPHLPLWMALAITMLLEPAAAAERLNVLIIAVDDLRVELGCYGSDTVKAAALSWHPRPAYPPGRSNPDVMGWSMRTARYRYTEWRQFDGDKSILGAGEVVARELYDHRTDPEETINCAVDPEHANAIARLGKRLDAHIRREKP